jgi:hypothetical protein
MSVGAIKGPARRELVPFEAIDWPIQPVQASCPHGDRQLVAPSAIGTPCWRDGKPLALVAEVDHA